MMELVPGTKSPGWPMPIYDCCRVVAPVRGSVVDGLKVIKTASASLPACRLIVNEPVTICIFQLVHHLKNLSVSDHIRPPFPFCHWSFWIVWLWGSRALPSVWQRPMTIFCLVLRPGRSWLVRWGPHRYQQGCPHILERVNPIVFRDV